MSIHYVAPGICESETDLSNGYANNISLALFIKAGDKTILFPGDLLKDGMKYLIENYEDFKTLIETDGIDYLIAPHHGLQTSFSELLFQKVRDNKTRLNIISEKVRNTDSDENRSDVDPRYYSSDYSTGDNSLNQNAVKTSKGHIVIDFLASENQVKQIEDTESLLSEFM